jgi:hydrogenase maturation protease
VYPAAYARTTEDRSQVRFECLVEGLSPLVDLEVRFLQIVRRGNRDEVVERAAAVGLFEQEPLHARIDATTVELRTGLHRFSASIENTSCWSGDAREEAMRHTLASAHAVARLTRGAFVSPRERPDEPLRNEGLWPVLVGEPGDRSTVLASPIILDDYPRVAPESPGDFFDGCEIDQLLVLSILGLSDEEKREVRAGDPRAREILERTEAMSTRQLLRLHGAWRGV